MLAVTGAAVPRAPSGEYKEMPAAVRGWTKVMHSPEGAYISQVLLGNENFESDRFEKFFRTELLPQFTLIKENVFIESDDPKELQLRHTSRLPKMREEFEKRFVSPAKQAKQQPQFEFLNKITIDVMTQVALDNYDPLARYNAALMLANVPDYSSNNPAKEALPALIRCLDSIDMVRVAALDGIAEQIKAGNADADRRKIQDALIKIVLDAKPPAGDSVDGHNWVRRKAIEVLVAIGDPGNGQAVLKALAKVIKDSQSSVELSCAAAKAIGSFSLKGVVGLEPGPLAASIGQVGLEALKTELARAADLAAAAPIPVAQRGGNGGVGGPPLPGRFGIGANGGGAAPPPVEPTYISLPLLRSEFLPLQVGIQGTPVGAGNGVAAAAAGGKDAATVAKIDKGLSDLLDVCKLDPAAPILTYEQLKQKFEKPSSDLEAAVNRQPAGGRPAAAADAGDQFGEPSKTAPAKPGK